MNHTVCYVCSSGDQELSMPNYKFIQKNRPKQPMAVRGSGGIAIGVKFELLLTHEIIKIYDSYSDGINGLKLQQKGQNEIVIGIIGLDHLIATSTVKMLNNSLIMLQLYGMNFKTVNY